MSTAETAHLLTELDLKDDLTPGLKGAEGAVNHYDAAATKATRSTDHLARAHAGAAKAATNFKNRAGQLTTMLGGAGLLGGTVALVAGVKASIGAAEDWGRVTDRLTDLTGRSRQETSRFADAFDKLGVSGDRQIQIIGFMQKTLGGLAHNKAAAKKIEDDYGFSIRDSTGHMKSSFKMIQDFTEYFNNKHIRAVDKAALGTKLFGRSWTTLLPIFELGPKKMKDAMAGAMEMSDSQSKDLHRWRDAQRELNDTIGDTKVQIGLMAIPAMTELSKALNEFLSTHQEDIKALFAQGIEAAKHFAGFVMHDVIPTLKSLADGAMTFWNSIPGPLKDMIVKGFVADRAVKFLFGFSPVGLVASIGKDVIGNTLKGIIGGFTQRGSSPANPMYVTGGVGGGAGGAAGGGMGMLGKAAAVAGIVGSVAAVGETINQFMQDRAGEQAGLHTQAAGLKNDNLAKAMTDVTNMTRLLAEADPAKKAGIQTFASKELQEALTNVADNIVAKATTSGDKSGGIEKLLAAQKQAQDYGWTDLASHIGADIDALKAKTPSAGDIGNAVGKKVPKPPSAKSVSKALSDYSKGDRQAFRKSNEAIIHLQQVESHKGNRAFIAESRRASKLLLAGVGDVGQIVNRQKVREAIRVAQHEQVRALKAGHTKLAHNLGRDIAAMKANLARKADTTNSKLTTIAHKDTSVKVTTNVTSTIGVRSLESAQSVVQRYGRVQAY